MTVGPKRVANLRDVAKAAGVSVATVSRHLNRSLFLPEATVTRIEAAIDNLGYRPNPHARRLSLGRSDTIGLVIPDIANPFFATLAAAVEEEADARGLGVALRSSLNRPGRELKYLDQLRHNEVDGLIFVTNHIDESGALAAEINRVERVVVLDEDVPGVEVPKIFCDNESAGQLAAEAFLTAGHRHVGFVGSDAAMISTFGRLGGFARRIHDGGSQISFVCHGDYTRAFGRQAALQFIERGMPATALFAASDELALGLLEVFREATITIPGELSLIGFDDTGPLHLLDPPLTTIRQPVREIGRRGVELLASLDKRLDEAPSPEFLPVEIVHRASVQPPTERARERAAAIRGRN
ncbi:transcriptional regulator, LacI family [Fulvimarina manganoxydans]|uniref:Transcriptional regulator, LacI family n=1 Tax=Fulvimarina manganoxydans TaxID=937218 RepID=A0A1W2EQN7_9HYPH|nr:LacI family DNA-binding transcriptional regulator [Fulvimarina manganoxydans]SMD12029.1 transcriptional regulator, LacI family [Fulvimarina manganoxydans]